MLRRNFIEYTSKGLGLFALAGLSLFKPLDGLYCKGKYVSAIKDFSIMAWNTITEGQTIKTRIETVDGMIYDINSSVSAELDESRISKDALEVPIRVKVVPGFQFDLKDNGGCVIRHGDYKIISNKRIA
jgi:hypothetical protein